MSCLINYGVAVPNFMKMINKTFCSAAPSGYLPPAGDEEYDNYDEEADDSDDYQDPQSQYGEDNQRDSQSGFRRWDFEEFWRNRFYTWGWG